MVGEGEAGRTELNGDRSSRITQLLASIDHNGTAGVQSPPLQSPVVLRQDCLDVWNDAIVSMWARALHEGLN